MLPLRMISQERKQAKEQGKREGKKGRKKDELTELNQKHFRLKR